MSGRATWSSSDLSPQMRDRLGLDTSPERRETSATRRARDLGRAQGGSAEVGAENGYTSEHAFQFAVMRYLRETLRLTAAYANTLESPRSPRYGAQLKAQGMVPGTPDVTIPYASGAYGALYLELKQSDNDVTDSQVDMLRALERAGNAVIVLDTLPQVRTFVREYLTTPDSFIGGI